MNKIIDIICVDCSSTVDVMSCVRTEKNKVEITYICPSCGDIEIETHYLYEKS